MTNVYKTLEQIAVKYKTLTLQNIKPSTYYKAPYDTGNMFNRVSSYNTIDRMIKTKDSPYVISLQYAPDGAYYGTYVHNGTTRMVKRPFARDAANSEAILNLIDDLGDSLMNDYATIQIDEIDRRIKRKLNESDRNITITFS